MKPLSQQYIYTNTEEALDYMDDCAKFIFPMVGFQLLELIITELKSQMTGYNSMPLIEITAFRLESKGFFNK